jgi:AcrR family transcriptional regulator
MTEILKQSEGLRARKQRETLRRIAETGLKLFLENGYEATTLDEIAAEAGIARRTFFYYFKSKEDILMAYLDGGVAQSIEAFLLTQPRESAPLVMVRDCLLQIFAYHDSEQALTVYKLLESTEALKSRMRAVSIEMEHSVFEALCELWPEPKMRDSLRMVAVVSMGALRVAKEAWRQDQGQHPLEKYLKESFATLEKLL